MLFAIFRKKDLVIRNLNRNFASEVQQKKEEGIMIISVANPIYDSVFKFLMEDERIAKTILSALLKEEVLSVEIRRHEHTNTTRDTLSMFRIDLPPR